MIEKHIILEDIDPVMFYGVGNGNLQMIKSLYPKLRIVARDNVIRVLGDEEEMAKAEEDIELMRKHLAKYNMLNEEDILDIVKGKQTKADSVKGVLVYSISGRPIKSRSENQQQLIEAYEKNDMIFAVGPAGTGKTYLSIALAVKALKEKAIKKIILSRPAVEAGEKLGFLPGDMKDKIDPYLQPYEHQDDHYRRPDTDRLASRAAKRTERGAQDSGRSRRNRSRETGAEGYCATQTRNPHRQRIRQV